MGLVELAGMETSTCSIFIMATFQQRRWRRRNNGPPPLVPVGECFLPDYLQLAGLQSLNRIST